MAEQREGFRLTGMWRKKLDSGIELFSGKFSRQKLREMVDKIDADRNEGDPEKNADEFVLTLWINNPDEKTEETSPDGALKATKPFVKKTKMEASRQAFSEPDDPF